MQNVLLILAKVSLAAASPVSLAGALRTLTSSGCFESVNPGLRGEGFWNGIAAFCYLGIYSMLVWTLVRIRRSPGLPRLRWTVAWMATFLVTDGATRLARIGSLWLPLSTLELTLRVTSVLIGVGLALYLWATAPQLAGALGNVLDLFSRRYEDTRRARAAESRTLVAESLADAAHAALAESDARFRLMVEGIRDYALYTIDPVGIVTSWNRGAERMFGFSEQEILGTHFSRLVAPELVQSGEVEAMMERAIEMRQSEDEGWRLRANGDRFFARVSKTALGDEDDQLRGFAVIVHDLTTTRRAEQKAREYDQRMKAFVDSAMDGVITIDARGIIESYNPACERLFGYTAEEALGRNIKMLMPEPYHSEHDGYLARYARTGQKQIMSSVGREVSGRRKDGSVFPVDLTVSEFQFDNAPHYSGIVRDITEQKRIASALEESRLSRLQMQERFLSHVSHELRTPLTAIYFFVSNVLDGLFGDLTPDQREQLRLTIENTKQLKDMVSDLLDITRIDTHKLTISSQPSNPLRLVLEVLSTCRKNADETGVELGTQFEGQLPFVWADPSRVRQILTNLIENAIKFTPAGGRVIVGNRPYQEGDEFLTLRVADTGCGIRAEDRDRIFDRLAQVQDSSEASRRGLGLGLFICRELVTRHGGRIWVESEPNKGSTFFFTLPAFSLRQWCERVLSTENCDPVQITLLAVDLGTAGEPMTGDLLHDCKRTIERCIHPGQDVLLPMTGRENEAMPTVFVAACAGPQGISIIETRIRREFSASTKLAGVLLRLHATAVDVTRGADHEQQIAEISAQIEKLVDAHLVRKEC